MQREADVVRSLDQALGAAARERRQPRDLKRCLEQVHVLMGSGGRHVHVARQLGVIPQVADAQGRRSHQRMEILQVAYGLKVAQVALQVRGDVPS
jgi:hypothetical protein